MRNKIAFILISTLLFSYLFYEESAGLNFGIFSCILVTLIAIVNQQVLNSLEGKVMIAGTLISAFAVSKYGNELSVIANWISLALLSIIAIKPKTSILSGLLQSHLSFITSPIYFIIDLMAGFNQNEDHKGIKKLKKFLLVVVPIIILLIFIGLYAGSNPAFNNLLKNIKIDFITFGWVMFTLFGFLLSYTFFRPNFIDIIEKMDASFTTNLKDDNQSKPITILGLHWSITELIKSGVILFTLLNALILFVNCLDVYYLFIIKEKPEGLTYSEFIHQGVGQLIMSIIFAILIILFYFSGKINFIKENKWITILAGVWILQNIIMVSCNLAKNNLYVEEYSLTYKRIGVYVYLTLTIIGLISTWYKVKKKKSNYFLFYFNGWSFYLVMVISSLVNWDVLITNYSIHHSRTLDKEYLINLSDSNIPLLLDLQKSSIEKPEPTIKENSFSSSRDEFDSYESYDFDFDSELARKIERFMSKYLENNYKSRTYQDYVVYHELLKRDKNSELSNFKLIFGGKNEEILKQFKNITSLDLSNTNVSDFNSFEHLTQLKELNLSNTVVKTLNGLEQFKNLEVLDISRNGIKNFLVLQKLPNLKKLFVSDLSYDELRKLSAELPRTIVIHL